MVLNFLVQNDTNQLVQIDTAQCVQIDTEYYINVMCMLTRHFSPNMSVNMSSLRRTSAFTAASPLLGFWGVWLGAPAE